MKPSIYLFIKRIARFLTVISYSNICSSRDYKSFRKTNYFRTSTSTTIINFNVTNNITVGSDKPCKFSVRHRLKGRFVMGDNEADISADEGVLVKNVDEGAADSDTSGVSSSSATQKQ